MKKNDKTKLELIRVEGIKQLIKSTSTKTNLEQLIKDLFHKEVKDGYDSLDSLNKSQLIMIVNELNISSNNINEIYEQFRYGLKPGFIIFNYITNSGNCLDIDVMSKQIVLELENMLYSNDPRYKRLKLKDSENVGTSTYEFSFEFLSKYNYIDETDTATTIYELKDCFVWVNVENGFIAIKSCPNDIQNRLINIFSKILNATMYNIKITKSLIGKIFSGRVKKGSFVNINPKEDEV